MTETYLDRAKGQIAVGDVQSATALALIAIAEALQERQRQAGPDLDLLRCNCGHSASHHNMRVDADGHIAMGVFGHSELNCDDCDCQSFYTGLELIDGETYPRIVTLTAPQGPRP